MCFGGGGSRATIVMPDTKSYDRQFDLQKAAMEQQMNGQSQLMQAQLNAAYRKKEDLMAQVNEAKMKKAENSRDAILNRQTELQDGQLTVLKEELAMEKARQMSVMIGAPPPEKSASAPVVGPARKGSETGRKGKAALRIERTTASSVGQGAGLNIT
jgi:hypothetical protein